MPMSEEHKAALAEGRRQARVVRAYLEALADRRPGRPVTPETLQTRLTNTERRLDEENDALRRLELEQQRLDLTAALEAASTVVDLEALQADFVAVAKSYGERKGVGYAAWRAVGVPASALKAAGIRQTRRRRSGSE
jgi:hypothetical protein